MRGIGYRFRCGFILTEMIITMVISVVLVLAIGILIVSGTRTWQQTYDSAHKQIEQDAQAIMITFGSMGRRANRLGYIIYNINGDTFTPAVPTSESLQVVSGNAVEFRYWDVEFDKADSQELMDVTKIATAYALFYLSGDQLKVDYGPYPPGAVPNGGGKRNTTTNVTTKVLADNVSTDKDNNIGAFSHTTLNGVGRGSVRINVTLTDPEDGESIKVMTATLMRNIWPR